MDMYGAGTWAGLYHIHNVKIMAVERSSSSKVTTHVTFVCQRCSQPIKLNKSLQAKALVSIAQGIQEKLRIEGELDAVQPDIRDELVPMPRERSSPTVAQKIISDRRSSMETLSVIYDSLNAYNHPDRKNTMKQIQIASETFKMLSAHSDIDHPLCGECPEAVLDMYDQEIMEIEKARQDYDQLGHHLQKEVEGYRSEMEELDAELEEMRKREKELKVRLMKAEKQRKEIAEEKKEQEKKEARLKEEEQAYWKDFNQHQHRMLEFKDDQMSVQYQLHYSNEQLSKLKKTNVLNSTFHIWHNGHFGTINSLRLGRLQTVPVEWTEINAAWGQTCFLLSTLARFTGVEFDRFRLGTNHSWNHWMPRGSSSLSTAAQG